MKNTLLALLCLFMFLGAAASGTSKQKIGTYDSRLVAVAYIRSEFMTKTRIELMDSIKAAQNRKDTIAVQRFMSMGPLYQRIFHDKGFGKGSVNEYLDKKKEEINTIAKKENLSMIVSKWELNYIAPEFEIVDITLKIAGLFLPEKLPDGKDPKAELEKMMKEMSSVQPIEDAFFIED